MKKNLIETLIFIIICISSLSLVAEESKLLSVELNHIPPEFSDSKKPLSLTIDVISGFEHIEEVYLFYRKTNIGYIQEETIKGSEINPFFKAVIPGDFIDEDVEYYFLIIKNDGQEMTLPMWDPIDSPYYVPLRMVKAEKGTDKKVFQRLSPADEFNFNTNDFMVAISYFSIEDEIKDKTIKLYVDDIDVSENADITSNMLIYTPKEVAEGAHSINIVVYNDDGSIFNSREWIIEARKSKITQRLPITIDGNYYVNTRFLTTTADDSSSFYGKDDELKNFGQLQLRGSLKSFRCKAKVFLSSEESKKRQPINKYSLEMFIPHFSLYLGDQNQKFTSTTISGKTVRGVGGELDFRNFKLQSFYGQLKKNIKGSITLDTLASDTTYVDTIITGTYKRNCFGLRMQFGNERKFSFGLLALKVKDDMSSGKYTTNPQDNIVIGLDSKVGLFKQKLLLGGEISTSILNNDITDGVISDEDLDTLDIDIPFSPELVKNIIIINENMVPYMPNISSVAGNFYGRFFLITRKFNNLFNFKYSYFGGSYNSLGNPSLQKDKSGININNNLRLFNNQLSINAGYHTFADNLDDNLIGTTNTKGFFTNLNFFPASSTMPGFSAIYQKSGRNRDITPDSLFNSLDQLNSLTRFSTYYEVPTPFILNSDTRFTFNVSNSNLINNKYKIYDDTLNSFHFDIYDNNSQNYQFIVNSYFHDFPLISKISFSYMKSEIDNPEDSVITTRNDKRLSLREEYSFIPDKMETFFEYSWIDSQGPSDFTKNYFSLGFDNKFKLFQTDLSIIGEISYVLYNNKSEKESNYNQMECRLKISQKF